MDDNPAATTAAGLSKGKMLDPLWLQAAFFTGTNVLFMALATWWLYFSPLDAKVGAVQTASPRLGYAIGLALGVAALQLVGGALWDASMHLKTGIVPGGSDFLWPPHIMLYSSFLFSFVVALAAMAVIAVAGWQQGARDPRQWVRSNPYVGAVAIASLYMIFTIPGDALWHKLFGVDLTAWSPPHVMIGLMNAVVVVCALGLLAQSRRAGLAAFWLNAGMVALLALMLNVVYIVGVLEWELPGFQSAQVLARPLWAYPVVGGTLAYFVLLLAKYLTRARWAATGTALLFYAVRLGVTLTLNETGNIGPLAPLVFLGGALLIDLNVRERAARHAFRTLAIAAGYCVGYLLVALPVLSLRTNLPRFTAMDQVLCFIAMFVAALVLEPLARAVSRRLAAGAPAPTGRELSQGAPASNWGFYR
jgi:hypothetical protein